MILQLHEVLNRKHWTMPELFEHAHRHAYGFSNNDTNDFVQFTLYGILPLFVREYVQHILENES